MQESPWQPESQPNQTRLRWWSSRVTLILVLAVAVIAALIFFWNMMMAHTDELDESNIPVIMAEPVSKEYPQKDKAREGDSIYSLISKEKEGKTALVVEDEQPVVETAPDLSSKPMIAPSENKNEVIHMEEKTPKVLHQKEFFLQVGSLPSANEAEKELKRLKFKFKTLLSEWGVDIVQKDLGEKGIFHRIQVGPFSSKEKAQETCKNLSKQGGACFLIY